MNEASAAANPSPGAESTEINGSGVVSVPSLDERAAAVFGTDSPDLPIAATQPVPAPDAGAQARAERRAKLDAMRAKERASVDAHSALRERDELRRKLVEAESRHKEYETRIDPGSLTPERLFALAERMPNLSPQQLGEWLRERMANPEVAAREAAARAVDPKISALEKQIATQQRMIDDFLGKQSAAETRALEQQVAQEFFSFTSSNAATSPLAARFLEHHGADDFLVLAQSAAQHLPPSAGAQAVLDEIEERLSQLGAIYSAHSAAPQRRQAIPTPSHFAAAQAPTHVTNTLAQKRSSVVDEEAAWAQLPFEERSARLFR